MRIPFCSNSYQAPARPLSAQRCVNLIPEFAPADAKSKLWLYGSPGLVTFATCGSGPIRGMHHKKPYVYVVSGPHVYRLSNKGAVLALPGAAIDGTGPVTMANNGKQIVIVAEPKGYVVEADAVTQITDTDFPGATCVEYIGGYFVFVEPNSGRMFLSELLQGKQYDALDFVTAESAPDDLVRIIVDHKEIWAFGEDTTEIYIRVETTTGFPFRAQDGVFMEKGCLAKNSVAKLDNSVFWLAHDKSINRVVGFQPEIISTPAIAAEIATYEDLDKTEAFAYSQGGHTFYVIMFPSAADKLGRTFVYDCSTKMWSERKSGVETVARWRASCAVEAFERVLVGDSRTGKVFDLSSTTYTEDGNVIQRVAVSPPIFIDDGAISLDSLTVEFDPGVGLLTGQGFDPQAMLRVSKDGGYTFGVEHWRSIGLRGNYRNKATWNRLGRVELRGGVVELTISDPVRVAIIAADARLKAA